MVLFVRGSIWSHFCEWIRNSGDFHSQKEENQMSTKTEESTKNEN
jgi:hypothetical protein